MKGLEIVFAGTPEFAVPSLAALHASNHVVKAVYTQPDRPAGRGQVLQASPVKQWAMAQQIPVFQPLNFKDPANIAALAALKPEVMVVIAYGLILPQAILDIPRFGCINVHASLLPALRGAAPIQYAILQGDTESGVTIMQMDKGMDTGDIILQVKCAIPPDATAGMLHDTLSQLAIAPLLQTLDTLAKDGQIATKPQDHTRATMAPKLHKNLGKIDWQQPAATIYNLLRATSPWPGAFMQINDLAVKILKADCNLTRTCAIPGTIIAVTRAGIEVATGNGTITIRELQFPGRKPMSVAAWLNAHQNILHENMVLS